MVKDKEFYKNQFTSKVLNLETISKIKSSVKLTLNPPKGSVEPIDIVPLPKENEVDLVSAKESALKDIGDPVKILEALKKKTKLLSKSTAKIIRDSLPSLDRPLRGAAESLDGQGLGIPANELIQIADSLNELTRKVNEGKITKASIFKDKALPLLKRILDFEINTDYLSSLGEGKEKLKSLEWKSLSKEAKRHGKQIAFFFQAPIVISGFIHRNILTRLAPYWDIKPILKSGYVIKEVNFLVLRLDKVQRGSAEDFIKGLVKRVNEQAKNPVLPFFDITIEGPNLMAVVLIPEREARSAVKVFQQNHTVYVKA